MRITGVAMVQGGTNAWKIFFSTLVTPGVLLVFAQNVTDMLVLNNEVAGCIIPMTHAQNWDTAFIGVEQYVSPAADDTVRIGGALYAWSQMSDSDGVWEEDAAATGTCYRSFAFINEAAQSIVLKYRHNAGIRIWVWGVLLVREDTGDGGRERVSLPISLPQGLVRVLIKTEIQKGNNYLSIRCADSQGIDFSSLILDFNSRGGLDPRGVIRVLAPTAGSVFHLGDKLVVQWVINRQRLSAGVSVYFSPDAGMSWIALNNSVIKTEDPSYYSGDTGRYVWTIEDSLTSEHGNTYSTISQDCQIRVYSQYDPNRPEDVSGLFTITSAQEVRQQISSCLDGPQPKLLTSSMVFDAQGRRIFVKTARWPIKVNSAIPISSKTGAYCVHPPQDP